MPLRRYCYPGKQVADSIRCDHYCYRLYDQEWCDYRSQFYSSDSLCRTIVRVWVCEEWGADLQISPRIKTTSLPDGIAHFYRNIWFTGTRFRIRIPATRGIIRLFSRYWGNQLSVNIKSKNMSFYFLLFILLLYYQYFVFLLSGDVEYCCLPGPGKGDMIIAVYFMPPSTAPWGYYGEHYCLFCS